MIDYIQQIKAKFSLSKVDIGKYAKQKVGPMTFRIACFDIPGLGRVTQMEGKAMFGLMKMNTLMFTAFGKDLPLFSIDRIQVMRNDTLIIDLYDTRRKKAQYPKLMDIKKEAEKFPFHQLKSCWYDSLRLPCSVSVKTKGQRTELDAYETKYLKAFLSLVPTADDISFEVKKPLQAVYVDGLLSHGGASTDEFVKAIGKEKTTELYRKYLFGTL